MQGDLTVREFEEGIADGSLNPDTHNATLVAFHGGSRASFPIWWQGNVHKTSLAPSTYLPGSVLLVAVTPRQSDGPAAAPPRKPRVLLFDELTARDRLAWDLFVSFMSRRPGFPGDTAREAFTCADQFFAVRKEKKESGT